MTGRTSSGYRRRIAHSDNTSRSSTIRSCAGGPEQPDPGVASTALSVLFGAMAGYAVARIKFPGSDALFACNRLADDPDPKGFR